MREAIGFANKRLWVFCRRMAFLPFWVILIQTAVVAINTAKDPVSDWFRPISLYIPDHCEGDDPIVRYTREIRREFSGTYRGYYISPSNGSFPFLDSGVKPWPYKPRALATVRANMTNLMGGDARRLAPGEWYAGLDWTLDRPWRKPGTVTLYSNLFQVWPAEDIRCGGKSKT